MQHGIMIIMNTSLSFQLRVIIPWHRNLQDGGKVFLAGRIGYVGARKRVRAWIIRETERILHGWCLERREEPSGDGEMGRIRAIKGFAMGIKGFALYFNSNRKLLKGFKQISDSVIYSFQKGHTF